MAAYLENVALVDAMKAEVVMAAKEGRIDEDAYAMLVEAYAQFAGVKAKAVGSALMALAVFWRECEWFLVLA